MAELTALFRPEAVQARAGRQLGEIALVLPPRSLTVSAVAALAVAGLLGLLALGHLPRTVSMTGELVLGDGAPPVKAGAAGQVTALRVRDGQRVHRGEVLFAIDRDTHAPGGTNQAQVLAALVEQQQHVEQQIQATRDQIEQRALRRAERERVEAATGEQLAGEGVLQRAQAELLAHQVERMRPAADQHLIAGNAFDDLRSRALDAQGRVRELQRQQLAARADALSASNADAEADAQAQAQLLALQAQRTQLLAQRAAAQNAAGDLVRAPIDGVVANLAVQDGASVQPGQSLLVVLPQAAPIRAALQVPATALTALHANAPVLVRVDLGESSPRLLRGRVHSIDAAASTSDRNTGSYRVLVDLPTTSTLKPGMPVQASIRTHDRPLWAALTSGG